MKVITLNELYEMMAVMIEIGEGKDHKVYEPTCKFPYSYYKCERWILPRLWLKCSTRLMPTKMR